MPYISQASRQWLDPSLRILQGECLSPGDVTYCIYKLVMGYLSKNKTTYSRLALCLGILESAKMEFYRRIVVPYEERKECENGSIEM